MTKHIIASILFTVGVYLLTAFILWDIEWVTGQEWYSALSRAIVAVLVFVFNAGIWLHYAVTKG